MNNHQYRLSISKAINLAREQVEAERRAKKLVADKIQLVQEKQNLKIQIQQIIFWKKVRGDFYTSKEFKFIKQFIKVYGGKYHKGDTQKL